jgi:HEAT repeat protein
MREAPPRVEEPPRPAALGPEFAPQDPAIQALVARFQQAPAGQKTEIGLALIKIDSPEALAGAVALMLRLPPGDLKAEMSRALSNIETIEKRDFLLSLLPFADQEVRRALATAIGRQADGELLLRLTERYDRAATENERAGLAAILRATTAPEAQSTLSAIVDDPNNGLSDGIVRSAAEALARNGTAPALDTLFRKLSATADPQEQAELARLIAGVNNPSAEATLLSHAAGSKDASTAETRLPAIAALVNYPTLETLQLMRRLAASDPNAQVRALAQDIAFKTQRLIGR